MRQYLVVMIGALVLVVGLVAKSYLDKQRPSDAPIDRLVRAGMMLKEGLEGVQPAEYATLEPRFAALTAECVAIGTAATPTSKQLCERAEVLRQAIKAGTATREGAGEVQLTMDALAREVDARK
jgi:hypothetical protein